MKAKLSFSRWLGHYVVWLVIRGNKQARFLGYTSKDPLRPVWTNNHEPRTYPTRLAAAKALLSK